LTTLIFLLNACTRLKQHRHSPPSLFAVWEGGSCPPNPREYLFKLIFFPPKGEMHYLQNLRIFSVSQSVSFCCEWVNQRVKNSALSLSALRLHKRGGGSTSGLNGSGQRLIHNNHQWMWEKTGHTHSYAPQCRNSFNVYPTMINIHTSMSS